MIKTDFSKSLKLLFNARIIHLTLLYLIFVICHSLMIEMFVLNVQLLMLHATE